METTDTRTRNIDTLVICLAALLCSFSNDEVAPVKAMLCEVLRRSSLRKHGLFYMGQNQESGWTGGRICWSGTRGTLMR